MFRSALFTAVVFAVSAGSAFAASGESYRFEAYIDEAPEGVEVVEKVRVGRAGNGRVMVIVNAQGEGREPVTRLTREGAEESSVHLAGRTDQVVRVMEANPREKISGTVSVATDGTFVLRDIEN